MDVSADHGVVVSPAAAVIIGLCTCTVVIGVDVGVKRNKIASETSTGKYGGELRGR